MKIWIIINDERRGPFTFDELKAMDIDRDTPVWTVGMTDWQAAHAAPATAGLFPQVLAPTTDDADPLAIPQPIRREQSEEQPEERPVEQPEIDHIPVVPEFRPAPQATFREPEPAATPAYAAAPPAQEELPKTYLVWAILCTLCCCTPAGIVAIFMASQTRSRLRSGNIEGARRSSNATEWWLIISFTLGLMLLPLSLIMNFGALMGSI